MFDWGMDTSIHPIRDGAGFSRAYSSVDIIWGTQGITPEKLAAIKIANLPPGAKNLKIHLRRKQEGCASYELDGFVYSHVIYARPDGFYTITDIITAIDTL